MKKTTIISDLTKAEVKDHVEVRIYREGYGLEIGNTTYFGKMTLDIDLSELDELPKKFKWKKNEMSLPMYAQQLPAEGMATFFGPKDRENKENTPNELVEPINPNEFTGYSETP